MQYLDVRRDYGYNIVSPQTAARHIAEASRMYVNGTCTECGATVGWQDERQHSAFHNNYIHRSQVKDGFAVSAVKWCDMGDHAFKANAPGAQSLDIMQRNDAGVEERVTMDICGAHAFSTGTNSPTLRAVEAAYHQERTHVPPHVD